MAAAVADATAAEAEPRAPPAADEARAAADEVAPAAREATDETAPAAEEVPAAADETADETAEEAAADWETVVCETCETVAETVLTTEAELTLDEAPACRGSNSTTRGQLGGP